MRKKLTLCGTLLHLVCGVSLPRTVRRLCHGPCQSAVRSSWRRAFVHIHKHRLRSNHCRHSYGHCEQTRWAARCERCAPRTQTCSWGSPKRPGFEWRSSSNGRLSTDADFEQVLLHATVAKTWRRNTLLGTLRYDATISGSAPAYREFRMGGFRDLFGLTRNELSAQNAARVGLSYFHEVGNFARFPAFAGINLERGNAWNDRHSVHFEDAVAGASLWAGVETPIGPVYLAVGRADDARNAVYLSLSGARSKRFEPGS
jgi:hypothetical protein